MITQKVLVGLCLLSFSSFSSVIELNYLFDEVVRSESIYDPYSHSITCCNNKTSQVLPGTISLSLDYSANFYRFSNTVSFDTNSAYYSIFFVEDGASISIKSTWQNEFSSLLNFSPEVTLYPDTTYSRTKYVLDYDGVFESYSRTFDDVYVATHKYLSTQTEYIGDFDGGNYTEVTSYFFEHLTLNSNLTTNTVDYSSISSSEQELLNFIQGVDFSFISEVQSETVRTTYRDGTYESQTIEDYVSIRYEGDLRPIEVSVGGSSLYATFIILLLIVSTKHLRTSKLSIRFFLEILKKFWHCFVYRCA